MKPLPFIAVLLLSAQVSAQNSFIKTATHIGYKEQLPDGVNRVIDFLVIYENDSVLTFSVGPWECWISSRVTKSIKKTFKNASKYLYDNHSWADYCEVDTYVKQEDHYFREGSFYMEGDKQGKYLDRYVKVIGVSSTSIILKFKGENSDLWERDIYFRLK